MGSGPAGLGFGQYGTGPNGEPIVARVIAPLTGFVGQTLQLEVADIYMDGSGAGLASPGTWWSLDPSILSITSDGIASCVSAGVALIGTIIDGQVFIEGLFVVLAPALVSIMIIDNPSEMTVGQTVQLAVSGTYTDGSIRNVTTLSSWNSSGPGAAITGSGFVTALQPASITITANIGSIAASVVIQVIAAASTTPIVPEFMSHLTQVMLNYFDWKDPRVRRGRYTIDAQLLNLGAQQIQMSGLRFSREVGATTLHTCPANIDNSGVYWQQLLPGSFDYSLLNHDVVGLHGSTPFNMVEYDDQLPIPNRVTVNSSLSPIPLSDPLLFTITGVGDTFHHAWAAQRVGPFTPPFAGRVHFWVDQPGQFAVNLTVRITGQRAPMPAWSDALVTTSEKVVINSLGWASSKFGWAYISQIEVLNLPSGLTLSGYSSMLTLPMQPDPNRTYTDPAHRDIAYDRYWQYDGGFLTEQYMESNYNGWRFAQSYVTGNALSALAVEPYTWGMFAASGTTLYYFDRREPLPSNLSASALTREPYYGLDIVVDETQLTPIRIVVLNPLAYSGAPTVTKWRYVVQTPDGNTYALTPDGVFAEFTPTAGWRTGIPPALTIPLGAIGTYVFSLQAVGTDGTIVQDSTPWPNFPFAPLATIDLSSVVSQIQGLAFDDVGQLWVWDGTTATPLQLHYDAYVIDQGTQAIYLTDWVDGLTIDGITL